MLLAGIDIGSNAVRLMVGAVRKQDNHIVVYKDNLIRVPVRLGADVFRYGSISEEKAETLVNTMKTFKLALDIYKPKHYFACATSAMREAANKEEILRRLREEAGIDAAIIDGLEEARILALVNNIPLAKPFKFKLYIDVGGGSTELTLARGETTIKAESFRLGTIRLRDNLVSGHEWQRLKEWLRPLKGESDKIYPVGSGGNINKLFKMYGKSDNHLLNSRDLQTGYEALAGVTIAERISRFGLRPDRADVIVPAAEIFLKTLKWIGADFIHVPKKGLVDGILHMLYQQSAQTTADGFNSFTEAFPVSFVPA
jgi:exopolyphosphatase/guanosine-5'-triphosphate,3'-diphosphate pyrophosphatase